MTRPTSVYIIKPVGLDGPVKIGWSFAPEDRLTMLAAWSPIPLEIVAMIPGSLKLEQTIHANLWGSHSHREWFHPTKEVLAFVDKIRAGVPVEEAIDIRKRKPPRDRALRVWSPSARLKMSYNSKLRWALKREEKRRGVPLWLPDDVDHILNRMLDTPPTADGLERLESVLRDPSSHFLTREERFPSSRRAA